MRRDIADDMRRTFLPVDVQRAQDALKVLAEIDVTADLQLAGTCRWAATEHQTREHRHVATDGHVRRGIVRRADTETGGGGKQEKLEVAVVTGQAQADALAVELTETRKRIRVEP